MKTGNARRMLVQGLALSPWLVPSVLRAAAQPVTLNVYKDESCGCCGNWITHMADNGFESVIHHPADLTQVKLDLGVGYPLQSCHTAVSASGHLFEGHVPAKFVRQFLDAPPADALGLAVPGMPLGSPGMEVGEQFTPYEVLLFHKDGSTQVFAAVTAPEQQY